MQDINPIISEYVKEKSIDLVLDKKNILIGGYPARYIVNEKK